MEYRFDIAGCSRIYLSYLGILNYYDIIITKIFRSALIDIDDCLLLMKSKKDEINLKLLESRFKQTASFDVSEDKMLGHYENFLRVLKREGLVDEE